MKKTYKINNKINEPTNKNKKEKKSNNKIIEAIEKMIENNKLDDKNLFLLFYLLTFDISPCLQENIIKFFFKIINRYSYNKFAMIFDKNKELLNIILFIFKTSFFEVKIYTLNIILLIDKENNWNYLENKDIKTFIQKEILPMYLKEEVNNLIQEKEKQ